MTIAHRAASPTDRRFVVAAWSASYKRSPFAGIIPSADWADVMHPAIEGILDSHAARTLVAFESADPDFLYGFIAGDTSNRPPVVFYVYTKEAYRRSGVARGLFAALGVDPLRCFVYACETDASAALAHKIPAARFDNNAVRYPKEQRRKPL